MRKLALILLLAYFLPVHAQDTASVSRPLPAGRGALQGGEGEQEPTHAQDTASVSRPLPAGRGALQGGEGDLEPPKTSLCENVTLTATSTGLIGLGLLAAFQPDVNSWAVALRDEVMYYQPSKIGLDDYFQYLPAITPLVLNLCGFEGRHEMKRLLLLEGGSYLLGSGWLNTFKFGFAKERPDYSAHNSFPSGHTFTAFVGAEIIRREYGKEHPWLAVAAYSLATLVGVMRVYNNRHWAGDVLAGAGLGILSTTLVYWVLD